MKNIVGAIDRLWGSQEFLWRNQWRRVMKHWRTASLIKAIPIVTFNDLNRALENQKLTK